MKACMSSPSPAVWPSTDIELSHSPPLRIGTAASAGGLDAGRRAQPIEQLPVEEHRALVVVAAERRRQLERDQVVERDAGVRRLQVLQAAHEEAGAEQQQKAERDLRGDEPLAQEQRAAGAGDRAHRVLQRRPRIRAAGAKRRQQAEDDAGHERQAERERRESADPGCAVMSSGCPVGRHEREQRRASARRPAPARPGRRRTTATRLSTSSCRTSRPRDAPSDSRTAISFCRMKRPGDQQIGDVGARDEQHEADHAHQHDERGREIVAQPRVAHRRAGDDASALS